ncbi:hypothetical protein TNCV_2826631 [Trichonephila clavipes]|nr:hypothetical protein TNCV_2826631 [Trichonephila clavipes]
MAGLQWCWDQNHDTPATRLLGYRGHICLHVTTSLNERIAILFCNGIFFDLFLILKLKLGGATAHEGLLFPSQYTRSLGAEVHEQMSRSGGQSEARPPVFKSQASLVLIYRPTAEGMKGRVELAQPGNRTRTCDVEALYANISDKPYII